MRCSRMVADGVSEPTDAEATDAEVAAEILDGVVTFVDAQTPAVWADPVAAQAADRMIAALARARGYAH